MVSLHGSERQSKGVKEMNDKEKKLREALNEYFGSDVGDIANVDGETTSYAACPARFGILHVCGGDPVLNAFESSS